MTFPNFPCKRGTILAIAGKINHLHVICSDIYFSAQKGAYSVLAVNITSVPNDSPFDDACVLEAGDHPFIKHKSYVYYKEAVVYKVDLLQQKIQTKEVVIREDVTNEVFEKIINGFKISSFVNRKIRKALKECGILDSNG